MKTRALALVLTFIIVVFSTLLFFAILSLPKYILYFIGIMLLIVYSIIVYVITYTSLDYSSQDLEESIKKLF